MVIKRSTFTREEFIEKFLNVEHIKQSVEDMKTFHPDIDVDAEVELIIESEWRSYQRGY